MIININEWEWIANPYKLANTEINVSLKLVGAGMLIYMLTIFQ